MSGLGIGRVTDLRVQDDIKAGRLQHILQDHEPRNATADLCGLQARAPRSAQGALLHHLHARAVADRGGAGRLTPDAKRAHMSGKPQRGIMIKRTGNYGVLHQVVEHNGILYIGGIVAEDATLDMAAQTTQALQELKQILEEHGSGVDRILQIPVFITDTSLKPEMNRAWKEFFADASILPTRATLGISSIEEGVLIEIVTTAAIK